MQIHVAFLTLAGLCTAGIAYAQESNEVITNGPVSFVRGSARIQPSGGTAGAGVAYNFLPYTLPGEYFNPQTGNIENDPFDIAYASNAQPLQTSDWWTGIGLQWRGWVVGRSQPEGQIGRTVAFISEPFHMQFLDVTPVGDNNVPGISLPVHGLRMWNQNAISVRTDGKLSSADPFDPSLNFAGRGNIARESSPAVTVGLANIHPLGTAPREKAPFTNVKVQSYSDWGAAVSYTDQGASMAITMANGSPFVWFERTEGAAPFIVWAGDRDPRGELTVWYDHDNIIGLTVTTTYVPFNAVPQTVSTASYIVYADSGSWTEERATSASMSMFTNMAASRVAVLAVPHNIPQNDTNALLNALTDLRQYACLKIVDTKIHYPPIPGSDSSVVENGSTLPLGYDVKNSTLRLKHEVTGAAFPITGCAMGTPPLQIVLPHHRKVMTASSRLNIPQSGAGPKYTWNGVIGELQAYKGASYVREIRTKGLLPYLPGLAIYGNVENPLTPGQMSREDIYQELKRWFFVEEPIPPPNHLDSFIRNIGTYSGIQTPTYMQALAALYESLIIADQLSQTGSPGAPPDSQAFGNSIDPDLSRTKASVSAEMREEILQALKELVGQWGDINTAQFFAYNPTYKSTFGYPDGYGSVQNFNDHHFHYGYFLRAAAMIGRFDPAWMRAYMPMFDLLRRDVATYDRADSEYPFLREFSPFYGHSWANGTSDSGGNDQESTSEALNFAVGLIELGMLDENPDWRDIGMYLYEEEILAAEQYWFNQDADLSRSSTDYYNGNWPSQLVTFRGPDGSAWNTTLVTNVKQYGVFRNTFFGGIQGSYTIQATPLSAFTLYLGRNQDWLKATWDQYIKEVGDPDGVYDVIVSSLQARLPGAGTSVTDTGLGGALQRIARPHNFFQGSTNAMGKHWAYTLSALGQLDSTVVADTPMYGVFKNDGGRAYVVYNPTNLPVDVTFTDTVSNTQTTVNVPAFSLKTQTDSGTSLEEYPTPHDDDPRRLFLRAAGRLLPSPGAWKPTGGQSSYPADASGLASTLEIVPPRPDAANSTPLELPDAGFVQSWTGTFRGSLDPSGPPLTRFALYTNQSLQPGWQQDGEKNANVISARFVYDFNSDGKPDRVEILQNVPIFYGNSFLYKSKITEYYFNQIYGGQAGQIAVFVGDGMGGGTAPFPETVVKGTLTVQVYGGSGASPMFPVFVSEEASPLLNRASWVSPPYR